MWTADARQRGYTFVEIVIVMAILGGLSILTAHSLGAVRDSTDTLAAFRRARRGGERLAYQVHGMVSSARKLYVRGTVGNDYLAALELAPAPARGSRLPLVEEYEPLGPDADDLPQTGNMLLMAAETDPLTCPSDPARGQLLYVDVYRMVCVYPSEGGPRAVTRRDQPGRDLVVWVGAAYPSLAQVQAIADATQRQRVVRALYGTYGCRTLWDPDAPPAQAFRRIDASGGIAATPEAHPSVPEDRAVSPSGRLLYSKLQLARTDPALAQRRALLTSDAGDGWVPDGFEVKVAGASSQRKVWFRLIVEGQSTTGRDTAHDTTLIATLRDL